MKLSLGVSLVIVALSACVPGQINSVYVNGSFPYQRLQHIPYTHPLGAVVAGNPFAMDQAEFTQLVNEAIQTSDTKPDPNSEYQIHFVFGAKGAVPFDQVCTANPAPANLDGDEVNAALCYGGRLYTSLSAVPPSVKNPHDPEYRKFLRYITVRLFPGCAMGPIC